MSNESIERFDLYKTICGEDCMAVFTPNATSGKVVRYSDHERIVKELEAKFAIVYEQLVGRAKLIAYDTKNDISLYAVYTDDLEDVFADSRLPQRPPSLSDAIKEVEKMQTEIRKRNIDRDESNRLDAYRVNLLDQVADRLKSLGTQRED